MSNVTITLPAEYAAKVVADLKRLRSGYPDLSTPAMHVVMRRLSDALEGDAPKSIRKDVTHPVNAPAPTVVVTRREYLVPEDRYLLRVCNADLARPGVRHTVCDGHTALMAGTGSEIYGTMGLYPHAYAERLH